MDAVLRGADDGVLRGIVEEALPELRAKLDEADRSLPRFVWRELERYLTCRDFSLGFAWLHCDRCDVHRLVPWPTLHAGVAVGARDEAGRERLARYIRRGPIAKARLERGPTSLTARATGSATVRYSGTPEVQQDATRSATVAPR